MGGQDRKFQEERLREITRILETKNRLVVSELSKLLKTTDVTIRKDLTLLEKEGLLKRTYGGAVKGRPLFQGLPLDEKEKLHLVEKERIAVEALKMVHEGDVVILDSGSTTTQLARKMKELNNVTVITNALNIALELMQSNLEIILTGGALRKDSSTLVGPLAEGVLGMTSADKLFHGTDGIDYSAGATTPDIVEANTSRAMMKRAGENILLVDSSKFGRRSLGVICEMKEIDRMITTRKMERNEIKMLNQMGIEVVIV